MIQQVKTKLRLLAIIPLAVLLIGINIYEDPANIFHDSSKSIAKALKNGHEAYFGSGNGDERNVKMYTIKMMPKKVDCITIGPSLTYGIRKDDVGTESYYNISSSGLNFKDIMGLFALLEINNIHYDRIILCVDSYFFDERYAVVERNPNLSKYSEYMTSVLDDKEPVVPQEVKTSDIIKIKWEQAFSLTYFQSSFDFIRHSNSLILKTKRWGIVDDNTKDLSHFMCDGSWVYAADYRSHTLDYVLSDAEKYNIKAQFAYDIHSNKKYEDYFYKLIQFLLNKNVSLTLFLSPISPALWDRIENDKSHYFILDEIEKMANDVAENYGISIIGSYNPYKVGISNSDYWDCRHIKHDKLSIYFDFNK